MLFSSCFQLGSLQTFILVKVHFCYEYLDKFAYFQLSNRQVYFILLKNYRSKSVIHFCFPAKHKILNVQFFLIINCTFVFMNETLKFRRTEYVRSMENFHSTQHCGSIYPDLTAELVWIVLAGVTSFLSNTPLERDKKIFLDCKLSQFHRRDLIHCCRSKAHRSNKFHCLKIYVRRYTINFMRLRILMEY